MGISKLSKVIKEHSLKGYRERRLGYYSSKKIAIDASMSIYQFLIAIRSENGILEVGNKTTSHLVGIFYRTINMIESGVKPIFVFDGQAPESKSNELLKRKERRDVASEKYDEAKKDGDFEKMQMYEKRKTKITKEQIEDAKTLLGFMGIPIIVAPSEAEACCAFLAKRGLVDAVATEDMDALVFGSPILLRNFAASKSKKLPIQEYNLEQILKDLELSYDEFVDLCILLGCDFCDSVKGVGPKMALNLIREFKSIESIIENKKNLEIPNAWKYENARVIFKKFAEDIDLEIENMDSRDFDAENVKNFLVNIHGFNSERVIKGIERVISSKQKGNQGRLDSFFKLR